MNNEKNSSHMKMKSINQQTILHLIYEEGSISRVELAKKTGLSQQTVTNIVNRLLEEELVIEGEHIPLEGGSGRKRVSLSFNSLNHYMIGIEIAGKYVRGRLYNFNMECLESKQFLLEKYSGVEQLIEFIQSIITELIHHTPNPNKLKGIGINVQGLVDSQRGILLRVPGIGFLEYPIKTLLEEKYSVPVFVENDVNLLALHENLKGSLIESSNNITLKFDYGIGGAIFADNKLISGSNYVAGEFGHYKAFTGDDALECLCKSKGCLTTLWSLSGLRKNLGHTAESFVGALQQGDREIINLHQKMVHTLALSISNLVTILNPDTIVLTGKMIDVLGENVVEMMTELVIKNVPATCRQVQIKHLHEIPDDSMLATTLVVQHFMEIPFDILVV